MYGSPHDHDPEHMHRHDHEPWTLFGVRLTGELLGLLASVVLLLALVLVAFVDWFGRS